MKRKTLLKGAAFLLVFLLLLLAANRLMRYKAVTNGGNQELLNAENLYALADDSVDVLVLGSSQVAFGVSPVEMYDHSGLSAYSIGMSQASMMGNYYWMLEVCKKQDPSVVMLDVSTLFEVSLENSERVSADVMRVSSNKLALVQAVAALHGESVLSYLFPLVKYHTRWYSLSAEDFGGYDNDCCYRGFNITDKCIKGLSYNTLIIDNDDTTGNIRAMYEYQLVYFEQILAYCQENDIELLLFKTPKSSWTLSDSNQVQFLADSYGLTYLDFNYEELLEAIGFDITTDMKDKDHLNTSGADKLSDYLADYAAAQYDLPDRREDVDYDLQINGELYETERTDAYLCATTDPVEWLALLKEHTACDIFLSTYGDTAGLVSDELAALLADLGLETDLNELEEGYGFVAWLTNDGASVEEKTEESYVSISGTLDNGVAYQVTSRNQTSRKQSKQLIGGEDQSINTSGLNITVYDESTETIIETVAIDLETGEMTCVTRSD
ncbi:MAG: hypothetical protein LUG64_04845 [Clostridiales bacterium]|nr:hypothetical protein [Clostridiales bacterium]